MRAVSFVFWGDFLRTLAQDTVSQKALRNCSEEVRQEVSISVISEKGYEWSGTHLDRRLVMRNRYLS